jgi:type II secretory pathway pseudopilin PulG
MQSPSRHHPRHGVHAPGAFTLIELLVVIGIIAALVAMLIPAVSHVRKKGYESTSRATLTGIARSIDAYYDTFHAYPGPAGFDTTTATSNKISGAQNLVLGLCYPMLDSGPIQLPPAGRTVPKADGTVSTGIFVNPGSPVGPYNYAQRGASKPYEELKPFFNLTANSLTLPTNNNWSNGPAAGITGADAASGNTFNFPVFVDNFPDALPILYYRRLPGVSTPAARDNPTGGLAAYYLAENAEYTTANASPVASTGRSYDQKDAPLTSQTLGAMVSDSGNTAKGGYLLLSAGADRLYGTTGSDNDNLTVVGGQ